MGRITKKEAQDFRTKLSEYWENRGYLVLQENGETRLAVRRNSDGTPGREYNLADIGIRFRANSAKSVYDFVNLEATQALMDEVHSGHKVAWDGHNHSGKLTTSAGVALGALMTSCEDHIESEAYKTMSRGR